MSQVAGRRVEAADGGAEKENVGGGQEETRGGEVVLVARRFRHGTVRTARRLRELVAGGLIAANGVALTCRP